jgi:hypothetical protein
VFTVVEKEYINEKLEHSFLKVWRYWHAKRSRRLIEKTTKKEAEIEKLICHLGVFYRSDQTTSTPTHCDDNICVVEQRIQLLQGSTLGHNNRKTQT